MKGTRYKITVCDSPLEMSHGFSQTIDEISVGDLFINSHGVFKSYDDRTKGATDVKEIEFDELVYRSLKHFVTVRESINKEIKRMLRGKGNIKSSGDTLLFCWDDFEKTFLPKSRKKRLEESETPEETGERLARETIDKIKQDFDKILDNSKRIK